MNQKLKKRRLIVLIFSIMISFNYHPHSLLGLNSPHWGWMFSLLATILIFLLMKVRDPNTWKQKLGINFHRSDFRNFIIITVLLLVGSYFLVSFLAMQAGYQFKPELFFYKTYAGQHYPFHYVIAGYLYYLPETLNEEMLIGAFLLFELERRFKKLNPIYIAILFALIFSFMHQALYMWSPVQPGELLTLNTIASLFFVGILRNTLILKTRNIALSWAIHLSFNLVFFSGYFIHIDSQTFPTEPGVFNIVFGNLTMLIISGLLALISLLWLKNDRLKARLF